MAQIVPLKAGWIFLLAEFSVKRTSDKTVSVNGFY